MAEDSPMQRRATRLLTYTLDILLLTINILDNRTFGISSRPLESVSLSAIGSDTSREKDVMTSFHEPPRGPRASDITITWMDVYFFLPVTKSVI